MLNLFLGSWAKPVREITLKLVFKIFISNFNLILEHVTYRQMSRFLMRLQAHYKKLAFKLANVDLESQEAFELARKVIIFYNFVKLSASDFFLIFSRYIYFFFIYLFRVCQGLKYLRIQWYILLNWYIFIYRILRSIYIVFAKMTIFYKTSLMKLHCH